MATKTPASLRLLIGLCAVSFVGEFLIHRHAYFALEATPFFFVLYGMACLAGSLVIGAILAPLFARPLDYYDADLEGETKESDDA